MEPFFADKILKAETDVSFKGTERGVFLRTVKEALPQVRGDGPQGIPPCGGVILAQEPVFPGEKPLGCC